MHATDEIPPPAPRPTTQMTLGCIIIPLIVVSALALFFFSIRAKASDQLIVPDDTALLVWAAPDEAAPLLARFGEGRVLEVTGHSPNWRWLEVRLWDGRRGWTLRPLDILVWQIEADVATPTPLDGPLPVVTPVAERMILIPPTAFTMGSPPGIGEADERPAHPVRLSAFEIDQNEVTVGQYWQCVLAEACGAPTSDASQTEPHYLKDPAFDNHPAINVPWVEANHYCGWRGKRLPTEAEWEMAAGWNIEKKAKLQWPWGNDPVQGQVNVGDTSLGEAAAVGSFVDDRSPTGVLDMAGNVSEWVFDWYKVDYYSVADDTDPTGPSHRRGEGTGRVIRGASFADQIDQARTANRRHQAETYGYPTIGFRCVREIDIAD